MKKIIAAILIISSSATLLAQSSNNVKAPKKALESVKSKYPSAQRAIWVKVDETYIATVKQGSNSINVYYDTNGNFLETQKDIALLDIPQPARTTFGDEFKSFALGEHKIVESATKDTLYKVILEKGNEIVELRLNSIGKIMKVDRRNK
jgi:hypothetical protein